MRCNIQKIICCGTATVTILTALSGCKAKTTVPESETKQTTVSTSKETDPYIEPVISPYSGQWPVKTGSLGDLKYNLQSVTIDFMSSERGYYIFDADGGDYPVNIIIAAGEFSTGGYDICIVDMDYDGKDFTVTVREIYPDPTDFVTEAFTYPCCEIQLNKLPGSVTVIDESGNELDCLYTYIDEYEIEPGWIAVIENGSGEYMSKTYVYETVDGKYSYINVISTTVNYGASKWNNVVRETGFADTKDDIVEIAKSFGSCGFVLFPDDNSSHSIDDFLNG